MSILPEGWCEKHREKWDGECYFCAREERAIKVMDELKHAIVHGDLSPRDLEETPPGDLTAKEARVAVQSMLDAGVVRLGPRLRLEVVPCTRPPRRSGAVDD